MSESVQYKRAALERLLERGMVMITVDARRPGVDVPARLGGDPQLRLNLSHRFGLPLEINDWGIRATLTFGGMSHPCKLPWSSVYQMLSHVSPEQALFPEDLPAEIVEMAGQPARPSTSEEPAVPLLRPAGARLAVVPGSGTGAGPAGEAGEPAPAAPRRAHLRRIK